MKKFKKIAGLLISFVMLFTMLPQGFAFAAEGTDATLSDIVFGNWGVPGFSPEKTEYSVKVPYIYTPNNFVTEVPTISVTTTDPNATAVISYPPYLDGDATITVTSADGTNKTNYTLSMTAVGKNKYMQGGMEFSAEDAEKKKYWSGTGSSTIKLSDVSYGGKHSLSVTKSSFGYHNSSPTYPVTLPADEVYISSYMARTASGAEHKTTQYAWDVGVGTGATFSKDIATYYEDNTETKSMAINGNWKRYSVVIPTNEVDGLCGIGYLAHSYFNWGVEPEVLIDDMYVGNLVCDVKIADAEGKRRTAIETPKENVTINLTASVVNQFGGKQGLEDETAGDMALVGAPEGVTIDNGILTIPAGTAPGTFYVASTAVPSFDHAAQKAVEGRYRVDILESFDSASLVDIEFDGRGVEGFDSGKMDYTMYVPYRYEKNNFNNFPEIEINAVPMDKNAKVDVTYPTADGEPIVIDVTATDGIAYKQYTITPVKIGANMFVDGGFEDTTKALTTTGAGKFTRVTEGIEAGTYALQYDRTGFAYYGFSTKPTALKDKMYIHSSDVKLSASHPADNAYSPSNYLEGFKGTQKHYDGNGNPKASGNISLTTSWQTTYATFVPSANWAVYPYYTNWGDANTSIVIDEYYVSDIVMADVDVKDTDSSSSGTVKIPETGSKDITLSATVLNQFGNTAGVALDTYTAINSWEVIGKPDGINVENGVVTISADAKPGIYKIQANAVPADDYKAAFTQSSANGRYILKVLPAKEGAKFEYKKGDSVVTEISSGDITCSSTYSYDGGEEIKVTFITALYKIEDNTESLISAKRGATYTMSVLPDAVSETYTVNVPDDGGKYIIRSFAWDIDTLIPFAAPYGKLE